MTNLPTPVSKCSQFSDDEPYDRFDLFVAEGRAADILTAARGISEEELEDNFVSSDIRSKANDLLDAALVEIRSHRDYRPTDPDFWDRVIERVRESVVRPPLVPNKYDISAQLYALFPPELVQAYPDAWFALPRRCDTAGNRDPAERRANTF